MEYRVDRNRPECVVSDLVRLWSANLPFRYDPRLKYEWFYRDNPAGPGEAFLLHAESDRGESSVVGCGGLGHRQIRHGDVVLRAGLLADFAVDRKHRLLMPALTLQRAVMERAKCAFDLFYGFPTAEAHGVFKRLGYGRLGELARYVKILEFKPFVQRVIRSERLAFLMGDLVGRVARIADWIRKPGRRSGRTLRWIERPGIEFDGLWESVARDHVFVGERSAAFLRWRFVDRPGVTSRLAGLYEARSSGLLAYGVVTLKDDGVALLADFLAASSAELGRLLDLLTIDLRKQGFAKIEIRFLGPRRLVRLFESHGFRHRGESKFVVIAAGERAGAALETDGLLNAEAWYLTDADRDN